MQALTKSMKSREETEKKNKNKKTNVIKKHLCGRAKKNILCLISV